MTSESGWKASAAQKFLKTLAKPRLRRLRRPWAEIIAFECRRELWRRSEEFPRLVIGEACEPCRLEISGAAVGGLDQVLHGVGQLCGKTEVQMNCGKQPFVHGLVAVADHGLAR